MMKTMNRHAKWLAAAALAVTVSWAGATVYGSTGDGVRYESGGVGHAELIEMRARFGQYSFWLTTAALGSGAYVADVQLRITDLDGNRPVLEHRMDGPWFLVDLPAGRYEVEASTPAGSASDVEVQRRATVVAKQGLRQMVLYFDTGDEVGAEAASPFEVSPYESSSY